jgi:hypothetical protein
MRFCEFFPITILMLRCWEMMVINGGSPVYTTTNRLKKKHNTWTLMRDLHG